jgi:hypothetical protein
MGHCGWDHDDVIDRLSTEIRSTARVTSLRRWLIPFIIGFPLGGLMVLGTIGLLNYAGPQLEAQFGPTIIKASHVVGSVTRTPNELCWETHFEKYDPRPPMLFSYTITLDGYDIPVPSYKVVDHKKTSLSQSGFSHHGPGEIWNSKYCIDMPEALLEQDQAFKVSGVGYYNSLLHLWRVPVPLPSFEVQPNSSFLLEPGNKRFSQQGRSPPSTVLREPSGQSTASPRQKEFSP